MRLASIKLGNTETAAVIGPAGILPIADLNAKTEKNWPTDMLELIESGRLEDMKTWYQAEGKSRIDEMRERAIPLDQVRFAPLYRHPRKIWGIGLNYVAHANDLAVKAPTLAPASFAKFESTIIGAGDDIHIPVQSEQTTAEAELAIIFGKTCKDVEEKDWLSAVAGFACALDMTTEEIVRINPRYLTRAKNFDTFFSFGPVLVTPDEIPDISEIKVATVINNTIYAQNVISNMTFPPSYLVSFHSGVTTMFPGDIILTGTPRAVQINEGDVVECRIDGFEPLVNPVIDLKLRKKS
jgi:2-keto-4-pentenoate hydratase/2-oxohepta-3-ene-1,7-dioic acid hydratase in catechol pathway